MSIKDSDHGFKAMLARVKDAVGGLTVGVHEAEGSATHEPEEGEPAPKEPLTIVEVLAMHEFGLGNNPRRSVVADWADENEAEHEEDLRKVATSLLEGHGSNIKNSINRLGARYVGDVQKRMVAGIPPPLKQATIDRKGSSTPLINSGQTKSAITYQVKKNADDD